jgi:hypothetical protein
LSELLPGSWCVRLALKVDCGFGLQVEEAKQGPDSKRCKVSAGESPVKPKVEEATASDGSVGDKKGTKQGKGKSSKTAAAVEPPKDYVHVRARRGQATDSHSLAERVNTAATPHFCHTI